MTPSVTMNGPCSAARWVESQTLSLNQKLRVRYPFIMRGNGEKQSESVGNTPFGYRRNRLRTFGFARDSVRIQLQYLLQQLQQIRCKNMEFVDQNQDGLMINKATEARSIWPRRARPNKLSPAAPPSARLTLEGREFP